MIPQTISSQPEANDTSLTGTASKSAAMKPGEANALWGEKIGRITVCFVGVVEGGPMATMGRGRSETIRLPPAILDKVQKGVS